MSNQREANFQGMRRPLTIDFYEKLHEKKRSLSPKLAALANWREPTAYRNNTAQELYGKCKNTLIKSQPHITSLKPQLNKGNSTQTATSRKG